MPNRPPINESDKRAIRQRCYFGCVVCGCPLYEYDHLDGYAQVKRHDPDRIVLLCDRHHRERGTGLLPTLDVENAARQPFNSRAGQSAPYALHFSGSRIRVDLGGNIVSHDNLPLDRPYVVLAIDRRNVIAFTLTGEQLLLSLDVVDALGKSIVRIEDNELVHTATSWDVTLIGRSLIVRDAPRSVALALTLDPPHGVRLDSARLPTQRGVYEISLDGLVTPNNVRISGLTSHNNGSGLSL